MTFKESLPFSIPIIVMIFLTIYSAVHHVFWVSFLSTIAVIICGFVGYMFYKEPTWETVLAEVKREQAEASARFEEWVRRIVREEMEK